MKLRAAIAVGIVLAAGPATVFGQSVKSGGFEVTTLSTRSDMVTGGDVLIRIVPPASTTNDVVVITVNGSAASAESKPTTEGDALLAHLKGLQLGKNTIAVGLKGQKPAVQTRGGESPDHRACAERAAPDAVQVRSASVRLQSAAR
jgi:uncharacterized tannase-like protein DUF6351